MHTTLFFVFLTEKIPVAEKLRLKEMDYMCYMSLGNQSQPIFQSKKRNIEAEFIVSITFAWQNVL